MKLQKTMDVLRSTMVETAFRPENEESRSLLDFVDEGGVDTMRTALKASLDQSEVGLSIPILYPLLSKFTGSTKRVL